VEGGRSKPPFETAGRYLRPGASNTDTSKNKRRPLGAFVHLIAEKAA
jgi:hypothetical protein